MNQIPENMEELKNFLISIHEKEYVELKSSSQLPKSFWETYSSFSNTMGGLIVLGIKEGKPKNEIIGVDSSEKIMTDLWNLLSNGNKVSYRTIENEDVSIISFDSKTVILINVREAPYNKKPVYLNGKIENSYIRTGDGDRKANLDEIKAMIRNAAPGLDSTIAENYTFDDLDMNSIVSFKERVTIRYPSVHFETTSPKDFLLKIGAVTRNRKDDKIKIKKGTLLFLGKYNSIRDMYPHFHLDFFNRRGDNPRWSDRVASDDLNDVEMNIFNFYQIVSAKLRNLEESSFQLGQNQIRNPQKTIDTSLREALVNCLSHADYTQPYPGIKIETFDSYYKFINPGKMLISPSQFIVGGESRIRNEQIMSFFRQLGVSERQGFGGPQIVREAIENEYRNPDIETNLERTELTIWKIDLADSYQELDDMQKAIFKTIIKAMKPIGFPVIQKSVGGTQYKIMKSLKGLIAEKHVVKVGAGKNTKYMVHMKSDELLSQLNMMMDKVKKSLREVYLK